MSLYSWVEKALQQRRSGQPPNYELVHHCPKCDRDYLCSDRFDFPECLPNKECKRQGWVMNDKWTCSPCLGSFDDENSLAWWEAHQLPSEIITPL